MGSQRSTVVAGHKPKTAARVGSARRGARAPVRSHDQATVGNQTIRRLLERHVIQTKLTINEPGDLFEQEANRVADRVMRMPEPQLQRACGGRCPKCQAEQLGQEHERLQTKRVQASDTGQMAPPPIVSEGLRSPGQPLDSATKAFIEPRFRHDFSQVPVHYGPFGVIQPKSVMSQPGDPLERKADKMAESVMRMPDPLRTGLEALSGMDLSHVRVHRNSSRPARLNALAYTQGRDIYVGRGQEKHLPHEGWHAVQQMQGRVKPTMQAKGVSINDDAGLEREADVMGAKALQKMHVSQNSSNAKVPDTVSRSRTPTVQRTIGDGHDLVSPRFSGNVILEAAFDDERLVRTGSSGTHVRLLQESLLDMGYNLPVFGADGIFGRETKAAVERFQHDATAVLIDGIVGPETMGLFDRHDTTRPGGVGPPATVGPLPGPRPPTRRGCEVPFAGVTFPPVTETGSGVSPAANIRIVINGGRRFLFMQGINSAVWQPRVTINAPDNPTAREFEVGFIQNLLSERLEYTYTSAIQVVSTLPTPIKDGAPLSSGAYHAIFVETGALNPGARQDFASNGDTRTLNWRDVPSDGAFINLLDNPSCGPPLAPATLLTAAFIDRFRLWLAVRHRPSGCVVPLKHIDWDLDWEVIILGSTVIPASNVINVSVNGDGSPSFIQGGQVPGDLLATSRVCRYGRCAIIPAFTRFGGSLDP